MKQGDNALGSVCPSVHLWVRVSVCLIGKFEAKKTITSLRYLYVSVGLGAFAANFAHVVDQLLILKYFRECVVILCCVC